MSSKTPTKKPRAERKKLLAAAVDDELHAAARQAAERRGKTVHDLIVQSFRRMIRMDRAPERES